MISCWDNTNNSCRIARTVLQHSNQRSVGQVSPHMVFERESDSLPRDGCRHDQVVKDELPFRLDPLAASSSTRIPKDEEEATDEVLEALGEPHRNLLANVVRRE